MHFKFDECVFYMDGMSFVGCIHILLLHDLRLDIKRIMLIQVG